MGRCRESFLNILALLVSTLFIDVQAQVGSTQQQAEARQSEVKDEYLSPNQRSPTRKEDNKADTFTRNRVDFMFTFGAPSTAKDPHVSNPGNKCIPGIRTYTEDVKSARDCAWWEVWCNPKEHITNTDFGAKFNANLYPHPKMSTLILRYRDNAVSEYIYKECIDIDNIGKYGFQSWPTYDQPADYLPGFNIHELVTHYQPRLMVVPPSIRGPLLEYSLVSKCGTKSKLELAGCLNENRLSPNWTTLAYMNHQSSLGDNDVVSILKNDRNINHRKCIINFAGAESVTDFTDFLFGNSQSTAYCGRNGVHAGVSDELWHITHDVQYSAIIKPALATCHEVSCVGYSLGGALCNLFVMCANQGEENLTPADGPDMYDDYNSLVWVKAVSNPTSSTPSSKPTSSKPTSTIPTSKPSTRKPSSSRKPSSRAPVTGKPSTRRPTRKPSSSRKPSSRAPGTGKPSTRRPTRKPSSSRKKPSSRAPVTGKPSTRRPSIRPTTKQLF